MLQEERYVFLLEKDAILAGLSKELQSMIRDLWNMKNISFTGL